MFVAADPCRRPDNGGAVWACFLFRRTRKQEEDSCPKNSPHSSPRNQWLRGEFFSPNEGVFFSPCENNVLFDFVPQTQKNRDAKTVADGTGTRTPEMEDIERLPIVVTNLSDVQAWKMECSVSLRSRELRVNKNQIVAEKRLIRDVIVIDENQNGLYTDAVFQFCAVKFR